MSSDQSPRTRFRVIEGGLSTDTPAVNIPTVSRGHAEEERLSAAILRLVLLDVGITVLDALEEMCARADSSVDGDVARFLILKNELERIGIRWTSARPEHDLARNGYLALTWPDRLVRRYPELKPFHPEAHPGMALG